MRREYAVAIAFITSLISISLFAYFLLFRYTEMPWRIINTAWVSTPVSVLIALITMAAFKDEVENEELV